MSVVCVAFQALPLVFLSFFLQQAISWELAHSILLRIASCSFCCSLLTQLAWRHTIWLRLLFQYSRMSWRRYGNTLFNCLVIWSVRSSYISLDVALGYLRNLLSQHSLSKSSTSCTTGDPCPRVGVSSSSDESGAARMTIRICKQQTFVRSIDGQKSVRGLNISVCSSKRCRKGIIPGLRTRRESSRHGLAWGSRGGRSAYWC